MDNNNIETRLYEIEKDLKLIKTALGLCGSASAVLGKPAPLSASHHQAQLLADATACLKAIGVPAHLLGYKYLRESVVLAVNDPTILNFVTKELYPKVADAYHTTWTRVERAIRHAIETAWDRGNLDMLEGFFGHSTSKKRGNPTNSEFIATLTDYLLMKVTTYEMD